MTCIYSMYAFINPLFKFSPMSVYLVFVILCDPTSWALIPGSNSLYMVPGLLGLGSLLLLLLRSPPSTCPSSNWVSSSLFGSISVLLVITRVFNVVFLHIVLGIPYYYTDLNNKTRAVISRPVVVFQLILIFAQKVTDVHVRICGRSYSEISWDFTTEIEEEDLEF